jgi:hypothetical protein
MARVFFVMGSAGLVGYLQHRGNLRKSIGDSRIVLNSSLMRSVTVTPPSDDLHNFLLAYRLGAIQDRNNITVQGILEKTPTKAASEVGSSKVRRPAKRT